MLSSNGLLDLVRERGLYKRSTTDKLIIGDLELFIQQDLAVA